MTPGVSSGCPGYCSGSSSLCHNRGRCIEKSSGYVCDCSQSAYGGPSCREGVQSPASSLGSQPADIDALAPICGTERRRRVRRHTRSPLPPNWLMPGQI